MKCPDCGYECLPDDTECLACGINIKFAKENIEQSKKRSKEANERLEQQNKQLRKELGLSDDDDEEDIADDKQSESESSGNSKDTTDFNYKKHLEKKVECPKCGFENHESDKDCFKCGVIFEKIANNGREAASPETFRPEPIAARPVPEAAKPKAAGPTKSVHAPKQKTPPKESVVKTSAVNSQPKGSVKNVSKPDKQRHQTENDNNPSSSLLDKLKQNKVIIGGSVATLLIIVVASYFTMNFVKKVRIEKAKQAEIARINSIYNDFIQNKYVIKSMVDTLVEKNKFAKASESLDKYRIDKLAGELKEIDDYIAEMKLYRDVLKVPASEYEKNYRMFSELIQLNPAKPLYRKKQEFYKLKYASKCNRDALRYFRKKNNTVEALENSLGLIDKALYLRPGYRPYLKTKKRLLIEKLLFFEGNNKIKMAVRNDGLGRRIYAGQRKMTVWVKNVSNKPVYINVQYFIMIGKNQKKYTYNDVGKRMAGKLMPGEQTKGELYFRTKASPSELVFSHLVCGTISRTFP